MTIAQAIQWTQHQLEEVSGEDATADARTLVCAIAGIANGDMLKHLSTPFQGRMDAQLREMVERRKQHEPTQYIVGTAQFLGYDFRCDPRALVPRFETEMLAMQAFQLSRLHNLRTVLDLCTGSGCIAITLALFGLTTSACDCSEDALLLAKDNARLFNAKVSLYQGDMFDALEEGTCFDLIVSNPPYVKSKEIDTLQMEVRAHEPHMALDGGEDGLRFYKIIADHAHRYLSGDGWLLLEIGFGQAQSITQLLSEHFEQIEILPDMHGIERILRAKRRIDNAS